MIDMAYCANCGDKYREPKNFCENCGRALGRRYAETGVYPGHEGLAVALETAIDRSDTRQRKRRINSEGSNESFELYLKFLAVVALFHGLSLFMGQSITKLLDGSLGLLLLAGIVMAVLFKVIFDMRLGYSAARSLIETVLIGGLLYGCVYGVFWYMNENFMHSSKPLFDLSTFATHTVRTPTVIK